MAAHADPAPRLEAVAAPEAPARPHALYVELFGKGGLWGLGYDYQLGRLAFGSAASFSIIDREQIATLSPYVAAYPFGGDHHRFFAHAGPQLISVYTKSPVPEWNGYRSLGIGAELGAGYEYRNHVVLRAYLMGTAGKAGVAPWVGLSFGWSL